jgi:hypothetical protein
VLQWPRKLLHLNTDSATTPKVADKTAGKKQPVTARPLAVQLFNLEADPAESKNIASEHPMKVQELEAIMKQAWRDPS